MRSADSFHEYVQAVLSCCDRVAEATGWRPEVLDLGGSLAAPTVAPIPPLEHRLNRAVGADLLPPDPADCLSLADASADAVTLVAAHADARGEAPPAVVLEPGRALTSDTSLLLTSVVDVKDDTPLPHAVLDAGVSVAEPVRSEYHQLFNVTGGATRPVQPYRLVGPICTPADVLYHHWRLPELAPGHVLAIMDSGAYFVPFSTAFSFPRPAIVLQDGAEVVTARRREEFADLVAYDVLPPPAGAPAGGAPT
jgi:diaminopimelate decarboxylase